ncbi:MAG: acyl-CoA dehydratase activase [Methanoregulaceae archaeon]|jgi:predicted CoA-substrate-specific enzyme activase|nr:acyl-CoA dehydratase activase [Methanoregulaceae archaeon]
MITAGIDAGAATTKAVLMRDREIVGYRISITAFDFLTSAERIFHELLLASDINKNDVELVYATGYGKNAISFADKGISEITAHAKGVYFLFPGVRGIIDVGGQDSKIIVVEDGNVTDFLMNDKCAAGTGKFLEYTAKALEVPVDDLGALALASPHPAGITSMCTVFAESEVISLRARGIAKEDIAAGLIAGVAQRIVVMAKRMALTDHVAFVGGVAKNAGMKVALEKELGFTLFVPFEPQITGALGAAISAQGQQI